MKLCRLAAMASTAIALFAAPASAAVFTVTYSGTLADSQYYNIDTDGIFGAKGASFGGTAFSAAFTIDTADGTSWNNANGTGWTQNSLAASNVALTVNNKTFTLGSLQAGSFHTPPSWQGSFLSSYTGISTDDVFMMANLYFYTYAAGAFPAFGTNFDITAPAGSYTAFDGALGNNILSGTVTKVSYAAQQAVPEPASWAMLVIGFGALGAAMRRSTLRVAFA